MLDADRAPERVADDRLLSGAARELRVELGLEACKPRVVDTREAEHLGRHRVLRIGAPLLGVEVQPCELPLRERARPVCRRLPVDVGEMRPLPREGVEDVLHVQAQDAGRDSCLLLRLRDRARVGVDRRRLLAERERRAHAVEDRAARGRQDDGSLRLLLSGP